MEWKKCTEATKIPMPSFERETNYDNGLQLHWCNRNVHYAIWSHNDFELQNVRNVFLIFLFGLNLKFYFRILKNFKISPKIVEIVKKKL